MSVDMSLIYDLVEEKLPLNVYDTITWQTMRDDTVGVAGIFLYESSNDEEDLSGAQIYNCIKVQIQVNSEQSEDGLKKALNYLSDFVENIENDTSNTLSDKIEIISARHLGPRALVIGKNDNDILVCRTTVDLKYIFTENDDTIRL